ncbi:UNVERIFIED_CONTAM: hypothetical protein FKN15_042650 [Acipenser sinensis]
MSRQRHQPYPRCRRDGSATSPTPAVGRAGSATSPTPAVGGAGSATRPTPAVGRAGSATSPTPAVGGVDSANSSNPAVGGASSATRGRQTAVPASAIRGRRAVVPSPAIRGAGAGSTSCRQQRRGTLAAATLARGSCTVGHAQGCLLLHTGYRVRGRSGAPAAASMARVSPPELASRGPAAAAVASRGSAAAAVASRGSAAAAVASRGSSAAAVAFRGSAAAAVASRGSAAAAVAWGRQGSCFAWGCPGSCFAWGHYTMTGAPRRGTAGHKERGEVRRPAPPAALSRPEIVWRETRKRELPAMKNWGVPDLPPWPPPWTLCFPLFRDFETEGEVAI